MVSLAKKPKIIRIRVDVEVTTTVECYVNGSVSDDGVFRTDSVSIGAAQPVADVGHREVVQQLASDVEYGNDPLFVDEHGGAVDMLVDEIEFGLTGDTIRLAPLVSASMEN